MNEFAVGACRPESTEAVLAGALSLLEPTAGEMPGAPSPLGSRPAVSTTTMPTMNYVRAEAVRWIVRMAWAGQGPPAGIGRFPRHPRRQSTSSTAMSPDTARRLPMTIGPVRHPGPNRPNGDHAAAFRSGGRHREETFDVTRTTSSCARSPSAPRRATRPLTSRQEAMTSVVAAAPVILAAERTPLAFSVTSQRPIRKPGSGSGNSRFDGVRAGPAMIPRGKVHGLHEHRTLRVPRRRTAAATTIRLTDTATTATVSTMGNTLSIWPRSSATIRPRAAEPGLLATVDMARSYSGAERFRPRYNSLVLGPERDRCVGPHLTVSAATTLPVLRGSAVRCSPSCQAVPS